MEIFPIRSGSERPSITIQILNDDGTVFDITGATGATFTMFNNDGNKIAAGAAYIMDEDYGYVRYDWTASDTDTVGKFYAFFEVTLSDDTVLRVPARNDLVIEVTGVSV